MDMLGWDVEAPILLTRDIETYARFTLQRMIILIATQRIRVCMVCTKSENLPGYQNYQYKTKQNKKHNPRTPQKSSSSQQPHKSFPAAPTPLQLRDQLRHRSPSKRKSKSHQLPRVRLKLSTQRPYKSLEMGHQIVKVYR
jgi:hypothetical protein